MLWSERKCSVHWKVVSPIPWVLGELSVLLNSVDALIRESWNKCYEPARQWTVVEVMPEAMMWNVEQYTDKCFSEALRVVGCHREDIERK
jgi:hypothetical protein